MPPVFHVSKLDNTLACYPNTPGFAIGFRSSSPPWYAGLRLVNSGIAFDWPIGDRGYGMRDFSLRDPDGNHIGIGASA